MAGNKQLFLILNGICRLLTLGVAFIVTAVGLDGIHSGALENTYERVRNNCNPPIECPTWAYDIVAFQALAILTLVCIFLAALVAVILHMVKMCSCTWILDAIVQAILALLSLTTGSILIDGANGFITEATTVPIYGLAYPPEFVYFAKKGINYGHLISAGSLAIINAFILILLIVLIVLSKPDK